jgi:hypothetical protein
MPVVNAKKLFVFLHQLFHFFLAVFKHWNPPVRYLDENSEAAAREAAAVRRWNDPGGGAARQDRVRNVACGRLQPAQPLTANSVVGRINHLDALNLAQMGAAGKTQITLVPRRLMAGAMNGAMNGVGRTIANEFAPTRRAG